MKDKPLSDEYIKGWCDGKIETTRVLNRKFKEAVERLNGRMILAKDGLDCRDAGYHTILELIDEIKNIFGEFE